MKTETELLPKELAERGFSADPDGYYRCRYSFNKNLKLVVWKHDDSGFRVTLSNENAYDEWIFIMEAPTLEEIFPVIDGLILTLKLVPEPS